VENAAQWQVPLKSCYRSIFNLAFMSQPATIAVVVPVYNASSYLRKCLEALASSVGAKFECIVVDDGSTDDSATVAQQFGARLLSTGGRKGPASARNIGARATSADLLFFIDSDVCVEPNTIAQVCSAFAGDPELAALMGSYDDEPESPDFVSQYKNLMHHYVHQKGCERATTFWSGCGAIRRDVFLRFSGFNEAQFARPAIEDIELGYRLAANGCKTILDRSLTVKHLKKWTFWGLVKTDMLDRGIPWTELILRDKSIPNDLNLQLSQRVSVAVVFLLLMAATAMAIRWRGYFLVPLFALVFILLGRYWVDVASRQRGRSATVILTACMAAIMGLAYAYHMRALAPLVVFAYLLLFLQNRYAHRHERRRWLIAGFVTCYAFLAVSFAITYSPRGPIDTIFSLLLLTVVILNGHFYLFLARKRGRLFALAAIPLHLLYHFYNGISFSIGLLRHLWRKMFERPPAGDPDQADPSAALPSESPSYSAKV
jgi:GT2 family glycosyltransferase